uniref:Uncharacterized protein n=1 Tax=Trichuris muris TaxID=70415 RepID=A0A5S6Q3G9_TRIMR
MVDMQLVWLFFICVLSVDKSWSLFRTLTLKVDDSAMQFWKKNLAPPDLPDVTDPIMKEYFERRYTECIYSEEITEEELFEMYFWPFRAVELPCLCNEEGLTNGKMKYWRYRPFKAEGWEKQDWQNTDEYSDVKDILEDFYTAFMNISQRSTVLRRPPMFTQQDGILVIHKAGLEVQGFYNCYDDDTKGGIEWVYVLIAMALPVAHPCYEMSEVKDGNLIAHQTLVHCPYKLVNGYYPMDKGAGRITSSELCLNAAPAPESCYGFRSFAPSDPCAKLQICTDYEELQSFYTCHYAQPDDGDYTHFFRNSRAHMFAYHYPMRFSMVVFPYEAWHLSYTPVRYPMEFIDEDSGAKGINQLEEDTFKINIVWTPWSRCTGCKPYKGRQTREGHCYFHARSGEVRAPERPAQFQSSFDNGKRLLPSEHYLSATHEFFRTPYQRRNFVPDMEDGYHYFEPGFRKIGQFLKHTLKQDGVRLMSSVFVDAFCGQAHGISNCTCLKHPYNYFFKKLMTNQLHPEYAEHVAEPHLVNCFDYSLYENSSAHIQYKFSGSIFHYFPMNESHHLGHVYTYASGYYIEIRDCYAECA